MPPLLAPDMIGYLPNKVRGVAVCILGLLIVLAATPLGLARSNTFAETFNTGAPTPTNAWSCSEVSGGTTCPIGDPTLAHPSYTLEFPDDENWAASTSAPSYHSDGGYDQVRLDYDVFSEYGGFTFQIVLGGQSTGPKVCVNGPYFGLAGPSSSCSATVEVGTDWREIRIILLYTSGTIHAGVFDMNNSPVGDSGDPISYGPGQNYIDSIYIGTGSGVSIDDILIEGHA